MPLPTVFLLFADALAAPEVTWSLSNAGYSVVAFLKEGTRSPLSRSRHATTFSVTAPESSLAHCIEEISAEITRHVRAAASTHPVVVLPADDSGLFVASKLPAELSHVLAGPPAGAVSFSMDKRQQIDLASRAGFHVIPTTHDARSIPWASRRTISKPRFALRQEGDRVLKDPFSIFETATGATPSPGTSSADLFLYQPYLSHTINHGIFGLATASGVVGWSAHQRIRMMNPNGSGSSACCSAPLDPALTAAASRLIELSQWRGLFMIELIRDDQGVDRFMEFNGRTWGSMALARRQGLEYPAWAVDAALTGKDPVPPPARPGEKTICRHLGREIIHVGFHLRATLRNPAHLPALAKALLSVSLPQRNSYWYNWKNDDKRVFFVDTYRTVLGSLRRR